MFVSEALSSFLPSGECRTLYNQILIMTMIIIIIILDILHLYIYKLFNVRIRLVVLALCESACRGHIVHY